MKEIYGDAWTLWQNTPGAALCILTNCTINSAGNGVMGRGIALEAKKRFPGIESTLGKHIKQYGTSVGRIYAGKDNKLLIAFPTKIDWWSKSDLQLIKKSAYDLQRYFPTRTVFLPRPGCGNGHLNWEDVKTEIEPFLRDNIIVVHYEA